MTRPSPTFRAVCLPAALLTGLAAAALAHHPVGPEIGRNRYKAEIATGPQGTDVDEYVGRLATGERLSVTVKSPFQSPLRPRLEIVDPDGRDRTDEAGVRSRNLDKLLSVRGFVVDRTGPWTVRVAGTIATQGGYTISFKVDGTPAGDLRDLALGGTEDSGRDHAFEALDGGQLDVSLTWARGAAPVELAALLDPEGREVRDAAGAAAADVATSTRKGVKLRRFPLSGGDGAYVLRVRAPEGATSYRLRWRVRPPERPTGSRKLTAPEPLVLRPPSGVIRAVAGMRIRVDGWYFSTGVAPTVRLGAARGGEVVVDPSGGFLDVTVPPGPDGESVPCFVINPDGQGSVADDLVYYVPPPEVTALVDTDGNAVTGGDARGGDLLRIEGRHLDSTQVVRFGDGPDVLPILRGDALEVTTPPTAPGVLDVHVVDAFGHDAVSPTPFEFKAPPAFAASPYVPGAAATDGSTVVLIFGSGFEPTDQLFFDGVPVAVDFVSSGVLRFNPPAGAERSVPVLVRDRFGLVGQGPDLRQKEPGEIDSVAVASGPRLGTSDISLHGGNGLRIAGAHFDVTDRVQVGTQPVTLSAAAATALDVTTLPSPAGLSGVTVTDALGRSDALADAVRFVGFRDRSSLRVPSITAADDRSGVRGAVGDVDGDGDEDDLVLAADAAPGTASRRTRLLLGDSSGVLVDRSAAKLPAAGSDSSGSDDWRAWALALGDLDGGDGPEIVLAGSPPGAATYGEVRVLVNDGSGGFTADEDLWPGSAYAAAVVARDENGTDHVVRSARVVRGRPAAVALGDLDGDDDLDVIVGRTSFESVDLGVDAAYVDYGQTPPYVSSADAASHVVGTTLYHPGTRVFLNDVATTGGLVDVTEDALPGAGDSTATSTTRVPALHARDLGLADLDGDGDLDLVVTWDDPTTVTAWGLQQGPRTDSPRIATRVLLNDGDGVFTDATDTWMPAASTPEFYQGSRLSLADVDGDGDSDLVLLLAESVEAFQGPAVYTRPALRVLRNDHDPDAGTGGFTDVTGSAVPAVPSTSNENWRGTALLVGDVDGDGAVDVLLGTTSAPRTLDNAPLRCTRLLSGTPGSLRLVENTGFLPPRTTDSGEADDLLRVPDLSSETRPAVIVVTETTPAASAGGRHLRVLDWQR